MGIIATILSAPTIAAQICAPLISTMKPSWASELITTSDWIVYDVPLDGLKFTKSTISGVAICSSATQTVSGMLPTISSEAEYQSIVHCWVRTIKPVVSEWMRHKEYDSAIECLKNCSKDAVAQMNGYTNQTLVNNIIKNGNQI